MKKVLINNNNNNNTPALSQSSCPGHVWSSDISTTIIKKMQSGIITYSLSFDTYKWIQTLIKLFVEVVFILNSSR